MRAETKALDAINKVPQNRQIVQRKNQDLTDLGNQVKETLAKANQSTSRSVAETEIDSAQVSYTALQTEIQQMQSKRAQIPEEYDGFIEKMTQVVQSAQRAYNLTLADSAAALSQSLESRMGELGELQFSVYMPQEAESVQGSYNSFRELFGQESFEQALAVGRALSATLEVQIPAAHRERARQTVQKADDRLSQASNLGGLQFAPEQLKAGQQALVEARALLQNQEYDQAYNSAYQAIGSADVAMDEIKRSIESQIEIIQNKIVEAEETGASRFSPQDLADGRAKLAEAFNFLSDNDYQSARTLQQEAEAAVERAFQAAKKGRAQEKLDRVAMILKRAKNQGASHYVPDSFLAAQEKMSEAQSVFNRGEYVEVHPVADLAENLALKTIADLKELASDKIEASKKQLDNARFSKAEQYASGLFTQAKNALADAKSELAADEFLNSLKSSETSQENGLAAENQAYRLRTEENLAATSEERQLAKASGSKEHSASLFLASLEKEKSAEILMGKMQFKEALAAATEAHDGFFRARMSKIDRAAAAVQSAVKALAEQYAPEKIKNGQATLSDANLDMKSKSYSTSNQKADAAYALAVEAETITWDKRGSEKIQNWEADWAKATENFAASKAPEPYGESKKYGVEAKAEYTVKNYQLAYDRAVLALAALDRVNKILDEQSAQSLAMINQRITELQALTQDEVGRTLLSGLIQIAGKAREKQEEMNYKEVFSLEQTFLASADTTEQQIKANNIKTLKDAFLQELGSLEQKGITHFLPESTDKLKSTLNGINSTSTAKAEEYAETMDQLKEMQEQISQMPDQADLKIQSSIAEMQEQLTEARLAGAEDLIPEEFGESIKAYQLALNYPRGVGGNYNEFYELMKVAQEKSKDTFDSTQLQIEVQTYEQNIQDYIGEMNSLLESFSTVTDFSDRMLIASASARSVDVYGELQYELTATALRRRAQLLRDKAKQLDVPSPRKAVQSVVVDTFEELVLMAELFERFGQYDKYDKVLREQYLTKAYKRLDRVNELSSRVQRMLVDQEGKSAGIKLDLGGFFR